MIKAQVEHRIPFHDVDIMYVAWHGHYFKYFELARTALMQKIGLDWPVLQEMGIAMPVIDSGARYRIPLLYDEKIVISAAIAEYQYPALEVHYEIFTAAGDEIKATGRTKQAYFQVAMRQTLLAVPDLVLEIYQQCEALGHPAGIGGDAGFSRPAPPL